MIDSSNYIPLYIQLRDHLKELLNQKKWVVGDRMPGENELCKEYQVSRTVVRQALLELELAGHVIRRKGKGTFVAGLKINEGLAQKLTGFYEDMVERGLKPKTRVLYKKVTSANALLVEKLKITKGSSVIEIRRLRFVDDIPLVLVTSFLPVALCPQLESVDLNDRSLYEFLEHDCQLSISQAYRTIEASLVNNEDATLLGIKPGVPVIKLESISFLENGTPIEYYQAFHRGDRARFEMNLIKVHDKWRALE